MATTALAGMGARETSPSPLPKRRLMIIAESPGKPVAHTGPRDQWLITRRLEDWLMRAGFRRGTVARSTWVTNAYPYYVPQLTAAHLRENQPWLMEQIRDVDPDVIIVVGSVACRSVLKWSLSVGTALSKELEGRTRWVLVLPHTSGRSRTLNTDEGRDSFEKAIKWLTWARVFFRLEETGEG